jgi:RNA polymerase sigma-70 factor, ECF subfamily
MIGAMADTLDASAIRPLLERGRLAHPSFVVDEAALSSYLAMHVDDDSPNVELAGRNAEDLYLACAVARGEPGAIEIYAARVEPAAAAVVQRLVKDSDLAADVIAAVREKLIVGIDGRGPRIADYGGHGDLIVWVRVIAMRAALSQLRAHHRFVPDDETLFSLAAPDGDPALLTAKRDSAAHIKSAFHEGLASLTPRQRNLLRQHLLDGLTIDELGAIYGVHRVTAARWLTAARSDLWRHARRVLRDSLKLSDASIGDMLAELRSTMDLSLDRVLHE